MRFFRSSASGSSGKPIAAAAALDEEELLLLLLLLLELEEEEDEPPYCSFYFCSVSSSFDFCRLRAAALPVGASPGVWIRTTWIPLPGHTMCRYLFLSLFDFVWSIAYCLKSRYEGSSFYGSCAGRSS